MKYEAMVIIGNDLNEKEAEKYITDSVLSQIKNLKGNITFEDFWGARGFAYRINKQTWGYYFVTQFELAPNAISELKREWSLDKKMVRYLVSKVDPKAPAPRPYAEQKKEWDALSETPKESTPSDDQSKKAHKGVSDSETEKKASTPSKEETEADKKLDEILKDSSLNL